MIRELSHAEAETALAESCLNLQAAGLPENTRHFLSAHAEPRSVVAILNPDGTIDAFELTGATMRERVAYCRYLRDQGTCLIGTS
jgi:hypothetical protein